MKTNLLLLSMLILPTTISFAAGAKPPPPLPPPPPGEAPIDTNIYILICIMLVYVGYFFGNRALILKKTNKNF